MSTESSMSVAAVLDGTERIADARHIASSFLDGLRDAHGLLVSVRTLETVELVVSELVTNARKYAPGTHLLTLAVQDGSVEVGLWDSSPITPTILAPDPFRVGQHGLEIVRASAQDFRVQREAKGKRITVAIALDEDPSRPATG
ncbi:ATP-binding protein [Streptomyces sp. NBC_01264]|uniref:ATP-binding protein n=1 Tax=Streptomyces sp. NBC_01264 TaxID=2903804 RepID=UPI00225A5B67|nr:ATP-binding protein [Streptomyces sp. NBC_01264]MCX4776163.1 ATP-binding protein [Streptomyces sp. NBC_01264]